MLQQRIRQRPNRAEIDRRARRHVLRKDTDPAFADATAEAKRAGCAYGAGCAALGASAGGDACVDGTAHGDGLGLGDADDVVAVAVGGGVGVGVGPDGVAESLDDGFGGLIVPGGAGAEAGAATVDSEGGDGSVEEEMEGDETQERSLVVHFDLCMVGKMGSSGVEGVRLGAGLNQWLSGLYEDGVGLFGIKGLVWELG